MFCGQEDKNRQRGNSEGWIHPIPPAPALLSSQNHFSGQTGLEPSVRHTLLPLHLNSELGAQLVSWARVIVINGDDVHRQIGHNRGEANSNESSLSSSWPSRKSGQARRSDSPFSRSLYPLSFDKISPVYNPRSDFYQRPPHQYHPRI